jgi:hypothetical protein
MVGSAEEGRRISKLGRRSREVSVSRGCFGSPLRAQIDRLGFGGDCAGRKSSLGVHTSKNGPCRDVDVERTRATMRSLVVGQKSTASYRLIVQCRTVCRSPTGEDAPGYRGRPLSEKQNKQRRRGLLPQRVGRGVSTAAYSDQRCTFSLVNCEQSWLAVYTDYKSLLDFTSSIRVVMVMVMVMVQYVNILPSISSR